MQYGGMDFFNIYNRNDNWSIYNQKSIQKTKRIRENGSRAFRDVYRQFEPITCVLSQGEFDNIKSKNR